MAGSVEDYLGELPWERREALQEVRKVVLDNLPAGYVETMNWGMICYEVPLAICPDTYNKQPLMFAGLASQKRHMGLYLMCVYSHQGSRDAFEEKFRASGKKLDMGKSCVRFKRLDDLPLEVIGETIAATPVEAYIQLYRESRRK
jgi:hypothetical protein